MITHLPDELLEKIALYAAIAYRRDKGYAPFVHRPFCLQSMYEQMSYYKEWLGVAIR